LFYSVGFGAANLTHLEGCSDELTVESNNERMFDKIEAGIVHPAGALARDLENTIFTGTFT
jgi:hypothetical protein